MSGFVSIQEALPRLHREFDWYHSFIREFYLSTPRCYEAFKNDTGKDAIGEAWAPRDLRMVVAVAGNPTVFGIEFLCYYVRVFSVQKLDELAFDCRLERDLVQISLGGALADGGNCWVAAKEVRVAFLGKEYLGPLLRLGHEAPREDAINAAKIDDYWRQCTDCSNAWIERPDIDYSRCPECGQLTKLVRSE